MCLMGVWWDDYFQVSSYGREEAQESYERAREADLFTARMMWAVRCLGNVMDDG